MATQAKRLQELMDAKREYDKTVSVTGELEALGVLTSEEAEKERGLAHKAFIRCKEQAGACLTAKEAAVGGKRGKAADQDDRGASKAGEEGATKPAAKKPKEVKADAVNDDGLALFHTRTAVALDEQRGVPEYLRHQRTHDSVAAHALQEHTHGDLADLVAE